MIKNKRILLARLVILGMFTGFLLLLQGCMSSKAEEQAANTIPDQTKAIPVSSSITQETPYPTAVFAGGCFWGVEYYLEQMDGVIDVVSGFAGGTLQNPGYYDVIRGDTGHVEAVLVTYDPEKVSYRELAMRFFEIHDPEQTNGQGPDIGSQYLSVIFFTTSEEKRIAEELIDILEHNGYSIATTVKEVSVFWQAEDYHQNYYAKSGKEPYCHVYTPRFPVSE